MNTFSPRKSKLPLDYFPDAGMCELFAAISAMCNLGFYFLPLSHKEVKEKNVQMVLGVNCSKTFQVL
jgi:hypothetical protein